MMRRASSAEIGRSHSKLIATECARSTGTRMRVAEDLARLLAHLDLLLVVAAHRVDTRVVAEDVEGEGVRHHTLLEGTPLEVGARGLAQLLHGGGSRTRGRLVARDQQPP